MLHRLFGKGFVEQLCLSASLETQTSMSSTTRALNLAPNATSCSPICSSRAPCCVLCRHLFSASPAIPYRAAESMKTVSNGSAGCQFRRQFLI